MSDPHDEGPVCDFCEIAVEPDETLEPIYVGEPPAPEPHVLRAHGPRGGYSNSREAGKLSVLRRALNGSQYVDLQESDRVHVFESIGGEAQMIPEENLRSDDINSIHGDVQITRRERDEIGVTIRIDPKPVNTTPAAEVCDTCAEMFKSL